MNQIIKKRNFRVQEKLVNSDKVVFVFTGMLTKIWQYRFFVKRLNKNGYSVVIYDYSNRLMHEAKLDEWQQFIDSIIEDAQSRLLQLKNKNVKHFYAYGYSMGTLLANKLTRDTRDIKHVILNLTYGDVVAHIWHSPATYKTRRNLRKNNVPMELLRSHMALLDPIVNSKGLKGKKILLHLARRDRFLHYPFSIETKAAFEKDNLDMLYMENKYLGHWAGGVKNMLAIKKIKAFFDS